MEVEVRHIYMRLSDQWTPVPNKSVSMEMDKKKENRTRKHISAINRNYNVIKSCA